MNNETHVCVMCHRDGATLDESFRVFVFANDGDLTLPIQYVHMTQPVEYWFWEVEIGNEVALILGMDSTIDIPACHMTCYVEWLRG